MGKGWDEIGNKSGSRGSSRFLNIEPNTTVTVRLLDVEPYTVRVHNIEQPVDGETVFRSILATPNIDDDYIEQNNPRYSAVPKYNIRVLRLTDSGEPDGIYILQGGVQIFRPLKEKYEKHGTDILQKDFEITRRGEGKGSSYSVGFAAYHSDIDVRKWIEKKEDDEALQWENVFPPITPEEQEEELEKAGLDVHYDPAADIAEHLELEEAKDVRISVGQYGPENYPPQGKTIEEIAIADEGYLEWLAEEFTSNDKVAAAARVMLQNLDRLGGGDTKKRVTSPSPFPDEEDEDEEDTVDPDDLTWPHKMPPETYVKRYPDGKDTDLALLLLGEDGEETTDDSSDSDFSDMGRDELISEVGRVFNEEDRFDDAMEIVRTIQKHGDGKNRVKDLTDGQLVSLLEDIS